MSRREHEIYKVTLWGSVGNLLLVAFKFVAAVVGHSSAMMADAVHSLSDFVTDIVVLVFVKVSAKPQDQSHDYGHGKFETFATFIIGTALIAAVGIIIAAANKVTDISEPHNLRTRHIGNWTAIEAHIRMDGDMPLRQAHDRATAIERKLKERFGQSTHISLHMEPVKNQPS